MPRTNQIIKLTLSPEFLREIDAFCAHIGANRSELFRRAMTEFLDRENPDHLSEFGRELRELEKKHGIKSGLSDMLKFLRRC